MEAISDLERVIQSERSIYSSKQTVENNHYIYGGNKRLVSFVLIIPLREKNLVSGATRLSCYVQEASMQRLVTLQNSHLSLPDHHVLPIWSMESV